MTREKTPTPRDTTPSQEVVFSCVDAGGSVDAEGVTVGVELVEGERPGVVGFSMVTSFVEFGGEAWSAAVRMPREADGGAVQLVHHN
jgi:hypothetical protein